MSNRAPARLPAPSVAGRLVYAIGDVHGRLDLLEPLVRAIAADALASRPDVRPVLVLLGDYVDRGLQSAGVVEFILKLTEDRSFDVRPLRGNHDEALLTFLGDPASGAAWAKHGAEATFASYGVTCPPMSSGPAEWSRASNDLRQALPLQHVEFFKSLEHALVIGDYVFVHAGLRPNVPLKLQSAHDLLWIRQDFLEAKDGLGRIVVHGHTPVKTPEALGRRVNIDTGAFATGVLTAVRLDDNGQTFMQVTAISQNEDGVPY
jgi:serine/threonine protein phosphatase 1